MMRDCDNENDTVDGLEESPSINEDRECLDSTRKSMADVKKRTLRNLAYFTVFYFLVYTGFWALSNLQSTMNGAGGIGDESQAVLYICSMVSSLLLPKLTIDRFGCKNVLVVGTVLYCVYMASNMYLRSEIIIPASALFGLVNGAYMAAQTFYVDEMATRYQPIMAGDMEVVMATFFGLYMCFVENTQIWGNLISYYALSYGNDFPPPPNVTVQSECGIHFLPTKNDTNSNLDPPTNEQRYILVGTFLSMGVLGTVVLGLFIDPLGNDLQPGTGCRTVWERLLAALGQLKNTKQILLIPITVYMGMEGPFYGNEFTQAYIACSWGVHHVGFVTVCFGVCGAIAALLVGPLVKCISQMAVLLLAACANLTTCILLYLWQPSPESSIEYFLFAGVWGAGDAIWWSQVTALYGLMFPNDREAAFSNLYFWTFLGFFLSYSYANYFTVATKINILLAFLITGMIGYLIGQFKIRCSARREYVAITQEEREYES